MSPAGPGAAAGRWAGPRPARCSRRSRHGALGLTLLELLVVLTLLGVASAVATLAMRDPAATQLEEDALRLAALLEAARAQSRSTGQPVRWQPTADGFAFQGLQGPPSEAGGWQHAGTQAQVQGGSALLLGPEPVIGPQAVVLSSAQAPDRRWQVATDGVRPFAAQPLPAVPGAP